MRDALDGPGDLRALVEQHPQLGTEAARLLDPGVPVTQRTTRGGGGPEAVAAQLERFRARLGEDRDRLGELR